MVFSTENIKIEPDDYTLFIKGYPSKINIEATNDEYNLYFTVDDNWTGEFVVNGTRLDFNNDSNTEADVNDIKKLEPYKLYCYSVSEYNIKGSIRDVFYYYDSPAN